jgi:hypothetical protein
MPTVREYKDGHGYYVLANFLNSIITFQVARAGARWLRRHTYRDGDFLDLQDLRTLHARGAIYTYGHGVDLGSALGSANIPLEVRRRRTKVQQQRRRSAVVKKLFLEAFPQAGTRGRAARLFALSIRTAHRANAAGWSATLAPDSRRFARLNVGRLDVLTFDREGEVRLLVHEPLMDPTALSELRALRRVGRRHQFKSRPRAVPVYLAGSELVDWYPSLGEAHHHVILALSYLIDLTPYTRTHSPGLIRYLQRRGLDAPEPIHA